MGLNDVCHSLIMLYKTGNIYKQMVITFIHNNSPEITTSKQASEQARERDNVIVAESFIFIQIHVVLEYNFISICALSSFTHTKTQSNIICVQTFWYIWAEYLSRCDSTGKKKNHISFSYWIRIICGAIFWVDTSQYILPLYGCYIFDSVCFFFRLPPFCVLFQLLLVIVFVFHLWNSFYLCQIR